MPKETKQDNTPRKTIQQTNKPRKTLTPRKTSTRKLKKQEEMKTIKQARGFWLKLAEEQRKIKQEEENSKKATVHDDKQQVYCKNERKNPSTLVSEFGRQNLEHSNSNSIPTNPTEISAQHNRKSEMQ